MTSLLTTSWSPQATALHRGLASAVQTILPPPRGRFLGLCRRATVDPSGALARLRTDAGEALSVHSRADAGSARGARGALSPGRPSPRPRLPRDAPALPRAPEGGVPDLVRRAPLQRLGNRRDGVRRGQPLLARAADRRRLGRSLRRALDR